MSASVLDDLRAETREAHARLDASVPVLKPTLDLAEYAALLARYEAAHGAVEDSLSLWNHSLAAAGVSLAARAKTPILEQDLAVVAARLGPHRASANVVATPPFNVTNIAAAFGTLYVSEGATLGGRVIVRLLATTELAMRHGLTSAHGFSYFAGYGDGTGAMWKEMTAAIVAYDADHPGQRTAIIDAAIATFAMFESTLVPDEAMSGTT